MTQYNSWNLNLSFSQLNNLKSSIKNKADVFLRLSWNIIGNSNDESNFYPLTNFEIQKCYQNELTFNGVYSRDNVEDKINDEAFVINPDEYSDIELNGLLCMHWIRMLLTYNE